MADSIILAWFCVAWISCWKEEIHEENEERISSGKLIDKYSSTFIMIINVTYTQMIEEKVERKLYLHGSH